MHGLDQIHNHNANPDAYHRAREPQHGHMTETQRPTDADLQRILADLGLSGRPKSLVKMLDDLFFTALLHDLCAEAERNGKKEPAQMERIESAIDVQPDTPFFRFWRKLNASLATARLPAADYGTAKSAFRGDDTPIGAMAFIGKQWDGLRAVPSEPVAFLGGKRPAYHGEYRIIDDDGTRWHKVTDRHGQPIAYGIPEAAITAADSTRDAKAIERLTK